MFQSPTTPTQARLAYRPATLWTPHYGLTKFADLFTNRQLVVLTTLATWSLTVREHRVIADGGTTEYADAVATYLGWRRARLSVTSQSSLCTLGSDDGDSPRSSSVARPSRWSGTSPRQPFCGAAGVLGWAWSTGLAKALEAFASRGQAGSFAGVCAVSVTFRRRFVISTDPPYYDNIGYSDLSDFFYVWLRRILARVYPTSCRRCSCPSRGARREPVPARRARKARRSSLRTDSARSSRAPARLRAIRLSRSRSITRSSRANGRRRGSIDRLGNPARGHDPSQAGRSRQPGRCARRVRDRHDRARVPTRSPRRSCCRFVRGLRARRPPTVAVHRGA